MSSKIKYTSEYADPTMRYKRYLAYFNGTTTGVLEDAAFEERFHEFLTEVLSPTRLPGWARRASPITGKLAYHHPDYNRLVHQFLDQFKDLNPEVERIVSPHEREFVMRPGRGETPEEIAARQEWDDSLHAFFRTVTARERVEGWEIVNADDENKPTHYRDPNYLSRFHKWLDERGVSPFYPEGFSVRVAEKVE